MSKRSIRTWTRPRRGLKLSRVTPGLATFTNLFCQAWRAKYLLGWPVANIGETLFSCPFQQHTAAKLDWGFRNKTHTFYDAPELSKGKRRGLSQWPDLIHASRAEKEAEERERQLAERGEAYKAQIASLKEDISSFKGKIKFWLSFLKILIFFYLFKGLTW